VPGEVFPRNGRTQFGHRFFKDISMAQYTAQILWERGEQDFLGRRYSRRHWLSFDGGAQVAGSSSPHVVPLPWSDPQAVDPEEAFVASLSSCHMLWFLSIAAEQGFCVDRYLDDAVGVMTRVTLRPQVSFSGVSVPSPKQLDALHHKAHDACFIANSVKTEVLCEPRHPGPQAQV
jgi:organic hydroperoxide reductase OsmC/OhrA